MGMPYWYLWALFVPLVAWCARRFPLTRTRWLAPAAAHLVIALNVTLLHSLLEMGVQQLLGMRHSSLGTFTVFSAVRAFWYLPGNLLAYAAILGSVIAADYSRRVRRGELAAAALTAELAEARLQALRSQLNPHFLFNAMNSIAMLVRKQENTAAVTMIAGLSDLMRSFLDERAPQEVTLRDELAFIERYLAVERLRFQDRLSVSIAADQRALDAYVPNLVLQPVVENALKHGIARRASAGQLDIRAEASGGTLTLTVQDDGPGPHGAADGNGTLPGLGLGNIRARLALLYGPGERLRLTRGAAGGAITTITMPFREHPA
jgi:LytS/YehU family sensor histidine kinase